ncbi:hypothetical protein D3C71_1641000 [compost metagenome]
MFPTAAGKAIGKDLIENLVGHPLRAAVGHVDGKLRQLSRRRLRLSLWTEPLLAVGPDQLEAVTAGCLALIQGQAGLVPLQPANLLPFHDQQPFFIVRLGA